MDKTIKVTEAEDRAYRKLLVERYGYFYVDDNGRVLLRGRPMEVVNGDPNPSR